MSRTEAMAAFTGAVYSVATVSLFPPAGRLPKLVEMATPAT
jgi:hypothetical protein